ncbi:MAG TPA: hypothetical protein VL282_16575, partial [Tepidisphaeraceae bacterium]|nr:hypothetical protein [Tepidisphaeraceae bacterium]
MSGRISGFRAGIVLAALCWASVAGAETSLLVRLGWDGIYRAGRWTPIYITTADSQPRSVNLEVSCPHDGIFAMQVRQSFTIGPQEQTFPIYCPTTYSLDQLTVTLRDSNTDKLLARFIQDMTAPQYMVQAQAIRPNDVLIAVSGRPAALNSLRRMNGSSSSIYVGYADPLLLPAVPIGYEALDLLILSQPDLNKISSEQQHAIADWVRAGGTLVMWPGDAPIAPSSPILQILPCAIGDTQAANLSPQTLKAFKLSERFKQLKSRELSPREGAKSFPIFDTDKNLVGCKQTVGFGRTVVLPIDPSEFFFERSNESDRFWKPIAKQSGFDLAVDK